MGRFVKGDVVVIPFPFSDLTDTKRRPALVVAQLQGSDLILCQITSVDRGDPYAIGVTDADFVSGALHRPSFICANRVFTGEASLVQGCIGRISQRKLAEVTEMIVAILNK